MKVGDKVVCVKEQNRWLSEDLTFIAGPVKGEIYTVSDTWYYSSDLFIELTEMAVPGGWNVKHFRPVDFSFGEKVCEEIVKQTEEVLCPH